MLKRSRTKGKNMREKRVYGVGEVKCHEMPSERGQTEVGWGHQVRMPVGRERLEHWETWNWNEWQMPAVGRRVACSGQSGALR